MNSPIKSFRFNGNREIKNKNKKVKRNNRKSTSENSNGGELLPLAKISIDNLTDKY